MSKNKQQNEHIEGIALRDLFAGLALAGLLARLQGGESPTMVAQEAFRYADALIEARKPCP